MRPTKLASQNVKYVALAWSFCHRRLIGWQKDVLGRRVYYNKLDCYFDWGSKCRKVVGTSTDLPYDAIDRSGFHLAISFK